MCSGANLALVQSLGASQVIDYTRQDFTQSGATYDVIFDAVGKLPPAQGKKALKPGGVYLNVHANSDGDEKLENLLLLKELIEAGKLKPVIDRVYPLEQIVEAHRYVEQGHKKGHIIAPSAMLIKHKERNSDHRQNGRQDKKGIRTMKAIVCTKYGPPDVLQLQEVAKPTPREDEVLVKVHAASVNAYDWHLLTADIFLVRLMGGGLRRPKKAIPGVDIAGRIEAAGR